MTALLRGRSTTVFKCEPRGDFALQADAEVIRSQLKAARRFPLRGFSRNLHDFGLSVTLLKTLSALCSPLLEQRTYQLYRADLLRIRIPVRPDSGFVFRLVAPHELNIIRQIEEMEEWLDGLLIRLLRGGSICLAALDGDRVAGFNIVSFKTIYLPVVRYQHQLQSGEVFGEQLTVHRAYRGRGLGSALRYEMFRLVRDRGKRNFYGGTDVHNKANLALCRKVGLRVLAEVRFRKMLWYETTTVRRVSSRPPDCG